MSGTFDTDSAQIDRAQFKFVGNLLRLLKSEDFRSLVLVKTNESEISTPQLQSDAHYSTDPS
jgi:hypothetical protein